MYHIQRKVRSCNSAQLFERLRQGQTVMSGFMVMMLVQLSCLVHECLCCCLHAWVQTVYLRISSSLPSLLASVMVVGLCLLTCLPSASEAKISFSLFLCREVYTLIMACQRQTGHVHMEEGHVHMEEGLV